MANKWGAYYSNTNPVVVNVAELNKANTLSLYLYGALSRPSEIADYIRPVDTQKLEVKIDGQTYYDTIGAITPFLRWHTRVTTSLHFLLADLTSSFDKREQMAL